MDISKVYWKKSFWVMTVIMVMMAGGLCTGLFFGSNFLIENFASEQALQNLAARLPGTMALLPLIIDNFYIWVVPGTLVVFLLFGWGIWLVTGLSLSGLFKQAGEQAAKAKQGKPKKKDFIDQKIEQERKRRLFLHSLSVLQREGRLLDFFDEDLSQYEDEQIGVAVRSIQEDCKKAVKKYIDPKPVMTGQEGDSVTIEPGFDVDAVKLVGNVAGEPPFKGVLKHRGWKAGKKDVPKLSDIQNSGIMTPAEVEIL